VKCPKCSYLGFETGDRCKNCGYDFSFLAGDAVAPTPDLTIRTNDAETAAPELWLDRVDRSMTEASRPAVDGDHLAGVAEAPAPELVTTPEPTLPLFNPEDPDDIPLIALPVAPRPPLSVRRTPETPRLRAVPKARRPSAQALDFRDEPDAAAEAEPVGVPAPSPGSLVAGDHRVGGRRLVAALVDHAVLFAIDAGIVYFTLRMAGLGLKEVAALPLAPLLTFVLLLKFAYFTAFTAIGGQTMGKMATGIRVVAERGSLDGTRAIRRTLAAVLSLVPLGLGYLPALIGADRRALHDRLTHTRVVRLPSE
jgi:uncharacterized RDD family membrane protein YckC